MKADDIIEMFAKGAPQPAEASQPVERATGQLSPEEAVAAALEAAGGTLKLRKAKVIARNASGISRMGEKRWAKILSKGEAAGLFVTGEKTLTLPDSGAPAKAPEAPPLVALSPPSGDWAPPQTHPCGHENYLAPDPEAALNQEARSEGFCCAEAQVKASSQKAAINIDWQVRGLAHPVPEVYQATRERHQGLGYPGLCCSKKTGLYIGGVGNDCRYSKGRELCQAHESKSAPLNNPS
jgi:hypothetical protein